MAFAERLNLSEEEIEKLRVAGLVHDIGKLKIPLKILHKPTYLTLKEYDIIKKHPLYSVMLLLNAGFDDNEALRMIVSHHERLDGTGYPNQLKREDISYLTEILEICDCYDAMKYPREYKGELDDDYIKNEFMKCSGTQFNEELASKFIDFMDEDLNNKDQMQL